MKICVQAFSWVEQHYKGVEEAGFGRERVYRDTVATETSADPMGSSRAGMGLLSCPEPT